MTFLDNLNNILEELSKHKRSRDELNEIYVSNRLNDSLTSYYADLIQSLEFLCRRDELKLMKKMNRG